MARATPLLLLGLVILAACERAELPSFARTIAVGIAKIAQTPGYVTYQTAETELHFQEGGVQSDYKRNQTYQSPGNGYQGYAILGYDPVRPDSLIEHAYIDNVAHGGDLEQEIRVDFREGTCITADMMRRALGVRPGPYKDDWTPPPHYPSHYYRPATYDLEFVIRDKYPEDDRHVFLARTAPCFRVVVVKKHFTQSSQK